METTQRNVIKKKMFWVNTASTQDIVGKTKSEHKYNSIVAQQSREIPDLFLTVSLLLQRIRKIHLHKSKFKKIQNQKEMMQLHV